MRQSLSENPMVWVIVQTVDGVEQFVGQHHQDAGVAYIPFFDEKEDAQNGLGLLRREKGRRYEVQAVRFRELAGDAVQHGFLLFRTDADGQILDRIDPNAIV